MATKEHPHHILVVDDEETLCEALRFNLEAEGYEVSVAYSAEEALALDFRTFDLILLDIMMGAVSGTRLARMIKSDPATSNIPIIFCTARDDVEDMVAGLNLGADDYHQALLVAQRFGTCQGRIAPHYRRQHYDITRIPHSRMLWTESGHGQQAMHRGWEGRSHAAQGV